jgi:hypothetical protein
MNAGVESPGGGGQVARQNGVLWQNGLRAMYLPGNETVGAAGGRAAEGCAAKTRRSRFRPPDT